MAESRASAGVGTLYAFVVDVNNLEICGRFWGQVLGAEVLYQNDAYVRLGQPGARPSLLLQKVPDGHVGKNRAHLDVDVTELQTAVQRVQELGGHQLREVRAYGIAWAVMTDPDGNEFCLVQHAEA